MKSFQNDIQREQNVKVKYIVCAWSLLVIECLLCYVVYVYHLAALNHIHITVTNHIIQMVNELSYQEMLKFWPGFLDMFLTLLWKTLKPPLSSVVKKVGNSCSNSLKCATINGGAWMAIFGMTTFILEHSLNSPRPVFSWFLMISTTFTIIFWLPPLRFVCLCLQLCLKLRQNSTTSQLRQQQISALALSLSLSPRFWSPDIL